MLYEPNAFSTVGVLTGSTWALNTPAEIIGRRFPHRVEDVFGDSAIHPYVVPWPNASDAFGVAWPAGTVGLAMTRTPLGKWSDADVLDQLQDVCRPVPGVLPPGYTARLARDVYHAATVAGAAGLHTAGTSSGLTKYRTDAGFGSTKWRPTTVTGATVQTETSGLDTIGTHSLVPGDFNFTVRVRLNHPGWRKLQVQLRSPTAFWDQPGANAAGTASINYSHNADGSTVPTVFGSVADGDTLDAAQNMGGLTLVPLGGSSGYYETAWYDLGEILATTGTPSQFYARCTSSSYLWTSTASPDGTAISGMTIRLRESERADIPFVFTATGINGLIAPGGLVT